MIKRPQKKKLISICIPVLNEEQNIEILYSELKSLAEQLKNKFNFEFIFTDNNSTDLTWNLIKNISEGDLRIRGYKFTRNIGFQQSIYFNYMQAKGEAIVQIDADLQDPPHIIIDFLNGWESGFKVVVGIRRGRRENFFSANLEKSDIPFYPKSQDLELRKMLETLG